MSYVHVVFRKEAGHSNGAYQLLGRGDGGATFGYGGNVEGDYRVPEKKRLGGKSFFVPDKSIQSITRMSDPEPEFD
ncbi:MAG: hypothetical protein ISS36_01775 [Candidatus Aenigmarchaeota archaeon]|nr:hypothetical protein [Candidatus Aenigmarchaeota archaeon]